MTKKEILDYITETPGNTNRAVLGDMLDSFEGGSGGGGGGGSSDFSTAKVTLNSSAQLPPLIYIGWVNRHTDPGIVPAISGENGTYDVILYKGVAYGIFNTASSVSITGSAEYDDGDLIITGDCTITVS